MSETKFTPGPWHPIEYAGYFELHQMPFYGEHSLLNEEECDRAKANAQLAAAAPELLAALQGMITRFGSTEKIFSDETNALMERAFAAINKATT